MSKERTVKLILDMIFIILTAVPVSEKYMIEWERCE